MYNLKGDAYLYGVAVPSPSKNKVESKFVALSEEVVTARDNYPVNAIPLTVQQEDRATLFEGANNKKAGSVGYPELNIGIDHPTNPTACVGNRGRVQVESPINGTPYGFVKRFDSDGSEIKLSESTKSKFKTSSEDHHFGELDHGTLEEQSATRPSQISHKVFVTFGWARKEVEGIRPFVGLGGEVEIGDERSVKNAQRNHALSQWGAWLKAGFTY